MHGIFKYFLVVLLMVIAPGCPVHANAEKIILMTESFPPYSYEQGGQVTGFAVDVVRAMARRLGHTDEIILLPWPRAYGLIQHRDNHALFSTARSPEREKLFKWVGPIATIRLAMMAKKGSGLIINDLADAKQVEAIGVSQDSYGDELLRKHGFQNVEAVVDTSINPRKLLANRIQLWFIPELPGYYYSLQAGVDHNQFEVVHVVSEDPLYLAFSKNVGDEIIAKWQAALDELHKDGSYEYLLHQYIQ